VHRFFVPPDWIEGEAVVLSNGVARQLSHVLRVRPGDRITVLDDSGFEYLVTLTRVASDKTRGVVVESSRSVNEPSVVVTLYQGTLKADRFELVLQKGTELGASAFVPTVCTRSVSRPRGASQGSSRLERWRRIVVEAAEQSGRGRLPELREPVSFGEACNQVGGPAIIPWEEEAGTGLKSGLGQLRPTAGALTSLGIFIGPEGGFTQEEVTQARAAGVVPVSLGRRILRAETAGVSVLAAVMYELGELGG
jgi:16S rRNA (uracil1498-N3)-methyltransferase